MFVLLTPALSLPGGHCHLFLPLCDERVLLVLCDSVFLYLAYGELALYCMLLDRRTDRPTGSLSQTKVEEGRRGKRTSEPLHHPDL